MTDREFTLKWVNQRRAKFGFKPLKDLLPGRRSNSCLCPVARSLGNAERCLLVNVGITTYNVYHDGDDLLTNKKGKLPKRVGAFIWAFDNGESDLDLVMA